MARDGSKGHPSGLGGVGRPSRWYGSDLETVEEVGVALSEVWEGSGGTPRGLRGVRSPSWRSEMSVEAIPNVWEG